MTAKYRLLSESLREGLAKLGPGERFESEKELTERFGCSRETVRRAIGLLADEGLLERVRGSGTYKARTPGTNVVAVIMTYVDDYIFPQLIASIEDALRAGGYSMRLIITRNRPELEREALLSMLSGGVDAAIIEASQSALPNVNYGLYERMKGVLPVVFMNTWREGFATVAVDDVCGGALAAGFLLENGHESVGGVFKFDDIQGHKRFEGYLQGLYAHGVGYSSDRVIWYSTPFSPERMEKRTLELIGECTGLVCYNDQVAAFVCDIIKKRGMSCPGDVSVVSFDDSEIARNLSLTSVAHPKGELGVRAANAAMSLIRRERGESFFFVPKLVVRSSAGAPKIRR